MEPTSVLVAGAIKAGIEAGAGAAGKELGANLMVFLKRYYGRRHPARQPIEGGGDGGDGGDGEQGEYGGLSAEDLAAMLLARAAQDPDMARELWKWLAEAQESGLIAPPAASGPPALAGPRLFVNRVRERETLVDAYVRARRAGLAAVVVIAGAAGSGKTALTRYSLAVDLAGRFPDGHFHLDLDSLDARSAADPGEAAAALLRRAGVPEAAIPIGAAERVAAYQRVVRGRRVCVVLDGVGQPGVVEALTPRSDAAMVLVIGSEPFAELLGSGADYVAVEAFGPEAGHDLLAAVLGAGRLGDDQDAIDRVVAACDGIPAVLAVAAGLLASHPDRSAAWLADLLEDDERGLAVFRASGRSMVERVFDATYADLEPAARRVYRRLGLVSNDAFTAEAVARLVAPGSSARDVRDVRDVLDRLVAKWLVTASEPGPRFGMERLVWLHARECADLLAEETAEDHMAARSRFREWYAATVLYADTATSSVGPLRSIDRSLPVAANPFRSSGAALDWIDVERPALMAVLREAAAAADAGAPGAAEDVIVIAERMWPYFTNRRPWNDFIEAYELAVAAAQRLGNRHYEARMRCLLSRPLRELSDLAGARAQVDEALRLVADAGPRLRGSVLEFVGLVGLDEGEPVEAYRLFSEARDLHASIGNRRGEGLMLQMMGRALDRSRDYERAVEVLAGALPTLHPDDERLQGRIRMDLAEALLNLGRYDEAAERLTEALPRLRAQRMELDERSALTMLKLARERS